MENFLDLTLEWGWALKEVGQVQGASTYLLHFFLSLPSGYLSQYIFLDDFIFTLIMWDKKLLLGESNFFVCRSMNNSP